jgi:hypothetical protein
MNQIYLRQFYTNKFNNLIINNKNLIYRNTNNTNFDHKWHQFDTFWLKPMEFGYKKTG